MANNYLIIIQFLVYYSMSTQNNSEPAFTHTAMQPAMYDSTSITATANTIGLRVFTLVHVALIIYSYYSENIYLAVS